MSHQDITRNWWNNERKYFKLYVSQIVIDEISLGDKNLARKRNISVKRIPVLLYNEDIKKLSDLYFKKFGFPQKALGDAIHIAFAVYYEMDFLLTWNCTHLANANTRVDLIEYNYKLGYKTPDICTPEELTGG